jgi:NAD(P)-dependent dehydrogenase (short-subunit alcohol dehydrogenase family)
MKLKNKVAIVTGASSGIGLAIAKIYIQEGAKVVLSDISETAGHQAAESLGANARFFKCNVADSKEVDALVVYAVETFGTLDIMVNNAGIGALGEISDVTDEDWNKVIAVNLNGVFYGSRAASKFMKEKGIKGSIINMSSILGTVGMEGTVAYCAAKGGVVQLTHAGALDLAKNGIRINAIAPGFIKTNMTKNFLASEFGDMVRANTPLGYVGEPEDIAKAALYLASDDSSYVTGEVLHVDGGWRAR